METSNHLDRERRRTKPKRVNWTKVLVNPQTFRFVVAVGQLITLVVRLVLLVSTLLAGK